MKYLEKKLFILSYLLGNSQSDVNWLLFDEINLEFQ